MRRIKCDEAKPQCMRCVVAGRECVNFLSPVTVATIEPAVMAQPSYRPTPIYAGSNHLEKQMFHLLRTEASIQVAGAFDHGFWSVDLPRATQTYPAVWHASISLAAVYQWLQEKNKGRTSERLYTFALQQYNKSIQRLVTIHPKSSDPSYENQETFLMVIILFSGICSIQKDMKGGEMHLTNGIQLFYKWRFWQHYSKSPRQSHILASRSLVTLFNRFELQYSLSKPPRSDWDILPDCPPTRPFASVTEAYFQQQLIINNLVKVCRQQEDSHITRYPLPLPEKRHSYRHQYTLWKEQFQKLENTDVRSMMILQLYSLATEMLLYIDFSKVELSWDEYRPSFVQFLAIAKQLYALETKTSPVGDDCTPSTFSFAPMVSEPLTAVVACCRDDKIRREGIELMKKWPLMDGAVEYQRSASVIEAGMMHEEENRESRGGGTCLECECIPREFICGHHRVLYRHVEQVGEGEASVQLLTVDDVLNNKPGKTVTVRW